MLKRLVRRLGFYVLTLFLIGSLNFSLIHLMPGDPLVHLLGEEGYARLAGQAGTAITALKADLGLDAPVGCQYRRFLVRMATGQWGWSYHYGQPVSRIISRRMSWTLVLLVPAITASTLVGGFLGALSGWRSRHCNHRLEANFFLGLYSIPAYCLGLLLLVAAGQWQWIPLTGMTDASGGFWPAARCLALPLTVLVLHGAAYKFMIMRHAVRQELAAAYVVTALSKGLTGRRVLLGHVVINTLPAYISVVALNIGFMVGGTLLVEVVFAYQGMGTLIYGAVLARDYPILSGALTALAIGVLAANGVADLFNTLIDPRIREGGAVG